MMTDTSSWVRVSRNGRCPVCSKDSWCTVSPDGSVVRCKHVQSPKACPGADGDAWLHVLREPMSCPPPSSNGHTKQNKNGVDWATMARQFSAAITPEQVTELAAKLHVEVVALVDLAVGFDQKSGTFTLPMFDKTGAVCGIKTRGSDWTQPMAKSGSKLGVFKRSTPDDGLLLVCEGESDTAAALSYGFDAIGTPGAGQVPEIVAAYANGRDVVLVQDNDEPGARGATTIAAAIRDVARSVRIVVPPCKDLRDWRAFGASREDVEKAIAAAKAIGGGRRMRPWIEVATDPPVAWLVDGLVPAGGCVVLAGEPGAGKTLLALHRALCAAHGRDVLGRRCRPGSTMFLAGEGSAGLATRLRAWRAAYQGERPSGTHYVVIVDGVPDLTKPSAVADLEHLIAAAERDYGHKPDCITIDTLATATPNCDENDSGPVGAVMAALAEIRRRHGCATELLHHTRKPSAERPQQGGMHAVRGSSAIVGAADVVLLAVGDQGTRALRTVKVRDGEILPPIAYRIAGQDTGLALDDGRPEHGPVVLPEQDAAPAAPRDPAAEEREAEDRVVAALAKLGSSNRIDAVVRAAKMNLEAGRDAFDRAVTQGRIVTNGQKRRPTYTVSTSAERAGAAPHTPGTSRTSNVPTSHDVPDAVGRRDVEPRKDLE